MLVEPVQRDLALTDFQISLLLGPAFGIFYVICGIPMGWIVDRFSRRWITILGVSIWGFATCLCGFASTYAQLFIGRMGVGLGESALTPTAHATIADEFPRDRLATAMSVFTLGSSIGGGLAVAIGGTLVHYASASDRVAVPIIGSIAPWQGVLIAIGLLTMITTPLALLIADRQRPASSNEANKQPISPGTGITLTGLVRSHWVLFVGGPIGFAFINAISNAYAAWVPTFMVRTYGWDIAEVGLAWGLQHSIAGAAGFMLSAFIVDRLYAKGWRDAHTRYAIGSLLVSVPASLLGFECGNPWLFLVLNAVFYLLSYGWIGYAAAFIQICAPPHLRGQISAILLAIATIVGNGLGAPVTAWFTDSVFGDKQMIGHSLSAATLIFAPCAIAILLMVRRTMMAMDGGSDVNTVKASTVKQ